MIHADKGKVDFDGTGLELTAEMVTVISSFYDMVKSDYGDEEAFRLFEHILKLAFGKDTEIHER